VPFERHYHLRTTALATRISRGCVQYVNGATPPPQRGARRQALEHHQRRGGGALGATWQNSCFSDAGNVAAGKRPKTG